MAQRDKTLVGVFMSHGMHEVPNLEGVLLTSKTGLFDKYVNFKRTKLVPDIEYHLLGIL